MGHGWGLIYTNLTFPSLIFAVLYHDFCQVFYKFLCFYYIFVQNGSHINEHGELRKWTKFISPPSIFSVLSKIFCIFLNKKYIFSTKFWGFSIFWCQFFLTQPSMVNYFHRPSFNYLPLIFRVFILVFKFFFTKKITFFQQILGF